MVKAIEELKNEYLDYFNGEGYEIEESENLLPLNKKAGVLFMVCGGIKYDNIFRGNENSLLQKIARTQNCLRTDNDYRIGYSPRHLTNFRMLEAFSFNNTELSEITDIMVNFLVSMGLSPEEIFLNVPNDDKEIAKNAQRYLSKGIEIRPLDSIKLSWGIKGGPLKGQRMEIGHKPTGWELWNVAYIDPKKRKLVDSGMALERLAATINGYDSVFEIPKFSRMTNKILSKFPYLEKEDAQYISDHILTLNEASSQRINPSAKGPGNKMRHLTKKVLARIRNPNGNIEKVLELLGNPLFNGEVKRIEDTYKKCEEEFKQYLKDNRHFDLNEYLTQRKSDSNSKYFDSPKLLNEEYLIIAMKEGRSIILPDLSKKELGKKYDLPIGLIERLKS